MSSVETNHDELIDSAKLDHLLGLVATMGTTGSIEPAADNGRDIDSVTRPGLRRHAANWIGWRELRHSR
jgi:hypothetical protein